MACVNFKMAVPPAQAAVFRDEAERARLVGAAKTVAGAPILLARLDVLLGDLRARGKMAYREHLLNRAHPRASEWPCRFVLSASHLP